MYLPNDDVRPTGVEAAEFIDVPEPEPDTEVDAETDDTAGSHSEAPGMETDAGG